MFSRTVMMIAMRNNSRTLRMSAISRNVQAQSASAEKLSIPVPEGANKPVNPKLDNIVSQIAGLNLLEVSELSSLLKSKLNIPDTAMMPMGGFAGPAAAAAPGKMKLDTQLIIKTDANLYRYS